MSEKLKKERNRVAVSVAFFFTFDTGGKSEADSHFQ